MEALSLEKEKLKYARFFIELENKKENKKSSLESIETLKIRLQSQKQNVLRAGGISANSRLDIFIETFGNIKLQEKIIVEILEYKYEGKTSFTLNYSGKNKSHLLLISSDNVVDDAINEINNIIDCSRYINPNESLFIDNGCLIGLNSKVECLSFLNKFMIRNNDNYQSDKVVSIGLY